MPGVLGLVGLECLTLTAVSTPATDRNTGANIVPKRAIVATLLGNWFEFFDFGVYALFAVMIGKQFFPVSSSSGQLLLSVGTFGAGFIMRPLGGLIIGAYADRAALERAVSAVGDRMKRPQQFLDYAAYLFVDRVEPEPGPWAELQAKAGVAGRLRRFADLVETVAPFEHDSLDQASRALAAEAGVKFGDLVMPARIALTGKKVSPGIFDVILLLGRERTARRLRDMAERLESASPAAAS